ncbi:14 kDa phosphohistidine phosphatase isoform X1 [Tyto alba]|uniref:14 kDa phosphohistidine phosphatase isoform X1 n=1 Tax=Tyto alba TaxID=56313 RepID=UPI001C678022|nr:14 kDa phosphohistidine phosphatase isoform X1 [Tyto alba]
MAAAGAALARVPDVEIDGGGVFNRPLRADGGGAGAAGPGLRVPGGRPPLSPPPGEEDPRLRVLGGLWASRPLRDHREAESQISRLRDHLGGRRLLTGCGRAAAPAWSWCSRLQRRGGGSGLPVLGSAPASPGFPLC